MDRRRFLKGALGANILAQLPAELLAQSLSATSTDEWDAGTLRHLLPAASDSRILIKASFFEPQVAAPVLHVNGRRFPGEMNDSQGEFWQFHADGLQSGRRYSLQLRSNSNAALCEPWRLSTFPAPGESVEKFRLLIYSCAGGLQRGFLSTQIRNRILRRGLSFAPEAVVANGDHVSWDDLSPRRDAAAQFDRSAVASGSSNEVLLKSFANPQVLPIYGTAFRSTPMFFIQDGYDQFQIDQTTAQSRSLPPSWFMAQLARATQQLYFPEFLPDANRPRYLPWTASDRSAGLSESFGTLRVGNLAEVLLYDVRRTMTSTGPTSVFIDPVVESWLKARNRSGDTSHVMHVPSGPLGWSAGRPGEWYPDVPGADGRLTTAIAKPYWQQGWLAQHDRIVRSLTNMHERSPFVVGGNLQALALGKMTRSGDMDLSSNPINIALAGSIGTGDGLSPSATNVVGPATPAHIDAVELIPPLEQHGFTIVDFEPDQTQLQLFRWDASLQHPDEIDDMLPFHVATIPRGASRDS